MFQQLPTPKVQQTQPMAREQTITLTGLPIDILLLCLQFRFPYCITPRIMFTIPEVSALFHVSTSMYKMLKNTMGNDQKLLFRFRKDTATNIRYRLNRPLSFFTTWETTSDWEEHQFVMFVDLINKLIKKDDLEFLQWVIMEYNYLPYKPKNWEDHICFNYINNLHILKWIVANLDTLKFHFSPRMCMDHAITRGNLDMVAFLYSIDSTLTACQYIDEAIYSGHLHIVQWLCVFVKEQTIERFNIDNVETAFRLGQMAIAKVIADTLTSYDLYHFYLNRNVTHTHSQYPIDFVNWAKEKVLADKECVMSRDSDIWFGLG